MMNEIEMPELPWLMEEEWIKRLRDGACQNVDIICCQKTHQGIKVQDPEDTLFTKDIMNAQVRGTSLIRSVVVLLCSL